MLIRPATESDLPALLAIYNDIIATSTAVYRDTPVSLDDRLDWFRSRTQSGYPILVASSDETSQPQVLGFSTFGDFRSGSGYRYTVEHTVHIRAGHRGQGVGTQVLLALFPYARQLGKHILIGGVDAENAGSLRFHERLGFERVAHFRQVGFKFNRWLDLIFLQRTL